MTLSIHKNSGPPLSLGNCINNIDEKPPQQYWPGLPTCQGIPLCIWRWSKVPHTFLIRAPQATVPEAMRVAQFLEDNIANLNIQKHILRRLPGRKKPTASLLVVAPMSVVACSPMTTLESDITKTRTSAAPLQNK
jgi:hypothetical protein